MWIECAEFFCPGGIANCVEEITYYVAVIVNDKSDGFICANSQVGSVAIDNYEALDANHSDEVIHINVERRLRDCFARDDFFFTN